MALEIEGRITHDLPLVEGVSSRGNNWKKKEWVMELTNGNTNFPKSVMFTCFGDRADQLKFEVGKSYVVSIDVESHEYNGRWFTNVNAWAAREAGTPAPAVGIQPAAPAAAPAQPAFQQPAAPAAPGLAAPGSDFAAGDATDDLPF